MSMTQTILSPRKNAYTMYSKNSIMPKTIGGIIEDIFQKGFNTTFGNTEDGWNDGSTHAPVNIQETDKAFELHLVAPALKKEDFKIGVDRNILTIAYEHKEEVKEEGNKWLRNEYKMRSFKRSFTLNEKIDASNISAKYTDGILYVNLPKKEQSEQKSQSINVE